jgi:N-acetyl sugar amidotransferase
MNSKFGLDTTVKVCKICLMTNQKPYSLNETKNSKNSKKKGLDFNIDDICSACTYHELKTSKINWRAREDELKKLLDKYRKDNGEYDCIVSGSGGKDSSFQSHILKNKYGMNPLTVTYSPILPTEIGLKNFYNWIDIGGFDNYLFRPSGKVSSVLAKEAFINLLHPMQPFKFGIKMFASKMALKFDINLVIYGEPYLEYGSGSKKENSFDEDFYINDDDNVYFGGLSVNELKKKYQWIKDSDLQSFMPIRSKEIKGKKLNPIFLGYYLKYDPQEIYYYATENCGFEPDTQRTDGTYGRYTGIDDKFDWLHFYTHYIKFGIGRCRFDASQEIRNNHITRDEGIMLLKKYEGEYPERYLEDCYRFMGIDRESANKIIDSFRPEHLWKKNKKNNWELIGNFY